MKGSLLVLTVLNCTVLMFLMLGNGNFWHNRESSTLICL